MTLVCTYDVPHLFPVLIIRGDVIVRLRVTFYARFRYLLLCPLDLQKTTTRGWGRSSVSCSTEYDVRLTNDHNVRTT